MTQSVLLEYRYLPRSRWHALRVNGDVQRMYPEPMWPDLLDAKGHVIPGTDVSALPTMDEWRAAYPPEEPGTARDGGAPRPKRGHAQK